jgi:hypothetical protein
MLDKALSSDKTVWFHCLPLHPANTDRQLGIILHRHACVGVLPGNVIPIWFMCMYARYESSALLVSSRLRHPPLQGLNVVWYRLITQRMWSFGERGSTDFVVRISLATEVHHFVQRKYSWNGRNAHFSTTPLVLAGPQATRGSPAHPKMFNSRRSKMQFILLRWAVLARSNTAIVGSNPT